MSRISPLFEVRRFADAIVYQRPREARMAETTSKRILVVDDASLVRRFYRDALERAGFEVDEALNGVEALEKLLGELVRPGDRRRQHAADGRLHLPRGAAPAGGCRSRRSRAGHQHRGWPAGRAAARAAGANFYLVKPVSQERLVEHVAIMCGLPA